MTTSSENEVQPMKYIDREHTWFRYVFFMSGLSLCITVDILQYSMPLAFLPSVLEDRGHSPMKIATAIGIYYWTGFLGGLVLTSYQIWRVLYTKESTAVDITPYSTVKRHIKFLIFGLGIGVITLLIQAVNPRWITHTSCRFIQGFVGAYIFFYTFLLSVALFKGQQQVVAMTFASCATVLAELAGPLLGSILFDMSGQRLVFWFLGLVSFGNQLMLVGVLYMVRPVEADCSSVMQPVMNHEDVDSEMPEQTWRWGDRFRPQRGAWKKLMTLLQNRTFICANLIITMAGVIKGSVEEMLPFHADHEWGYQPMEIGKLFCTVAVTYLIASIIVSQVWIKLGRFQIGFSSQCILLLGITAWMGFCVAYYTKDSTTLFCTFAAYGFGAGLAFTAAAQLIADVVDHEEGFFKDAANGLWNTWWEAGGSLGFFLGGALAHHHSDQMVLTGRYAICAAIVALSMISLGGNSSSDKGCMLMDKTEGKLDYGSTA
mmetsp:Transcript_39676/g.71221  ORF Transcript_39676/g.71221 Transcript_39676/m.71221 type:complete len:487 (-) Transcript_39676:44-1504(-)